VFSLEHCYFANRFPRWFGNIVANCPDLQARRYMIENMFVEEVKDPSIDAGHYESMVDFAVSTGARRQDVYDHVPSITQIMATHYWDDISCTRSWLDAFAGVGGLEFTNSAKLAGHDQIQLSHGKPPSVLVPLSPAGFDCLGLGQVRCSPSQAAAQL